MEAQLRSIISGDDRRLAARLLRPMLAAAAAPYRLAVATRNRLFDSSVLRAHRATVPVVSIGNLTLGGTGKTPFVEFVCRWFLDRGKRPVILSRGYRSGGGQNDEALVLQSNLPSVPHLQGKDRVALAGQAIEQFHPDVIVLDDGFQHRRLARDLDIVLIDCTEPFGYGYLFPRGLLREPVQSLARGDLIVLSRSNLCSNLARERIVSQVLAASGGKPVVLAEHQPAKLQSWSGATAPVASLAGKKVLGFCGIGNPSAFWTTLRSLGCDLVHTMQFPDHHTYPAPDINLIARQAASLKPDFVVCTQKDLVKIRACELGKTALFAVQIYLSVSNPACHLESALARVLLSPVSTATAA